MSNNGLPPFCFLVKKKKKTLHLIPTDDQDFAILLFFFPTKCHNVLPEFQGTSWTWLLRLYSLYYSVLLSVDLIWERTPKAAQEMGCSATAESII